VRFPTSSNLTYAHPPPLIQEKITPVHLLKAGLFEGPAFQQPTQALFRRTANWLSRSILPCSRYYLPAEDTKEPGIKDVKADRGKILQKNLTLTSARTFGGDCW